jgi:hypothetical protein
METLILKRHKFHFYFSVVFCFLILFGFAILFFYLFIGVFDKNLFFLPIFSPLLIYLAFHFVVTYYKNTPIVSVGNNFIKFGLTESYNITDIECIELTGKKPFKWFFNTPMEGTSIRFKNGIIKYIFDDLYSNSSELKLYLEQTIIEKKERFEVDSCNIDFEEYENEYVDYFKGSQFTSFRGIILWGTIVFYLYLLLSGNKLPNIMFLLIGSIFCIYIFLINSFQMNFFGVSEHYFVVKNHNFMWKEKIYRLNNIREVVFETRGKLPNCLRIITKDFKNKLYPASTLSKSTWLELKNILEKEGVVVRNECMR